MASPIPQSGSRTSHFPGYHARLLCCGKINLDLDDWLFVGGVDMRIHYTSGAREDLPHLLCLLTDGSYVHPVHPDREAGISGFPDLVNFLLGVGRDFGRKTRIPLDNLLDRVCRVTVGRVRSHRHPKFPGTDVPHLV